MLDSGGVRRLTVAAFLLVVSCASFALGTPRLCRKFVFPADEVESTRPPADARTWTLSARDGVTVHALELPGPPDAPVFVYFHNNRQTMVDGVDVGRDIQRRGFGVVLAEYRGYGLSKGSDPSEAGLYLDAEAVLDELAAKGVKADRIILWGASLGTGVAVEMAHRGRGSALVLVAPYTSIPDVVNAVVPVLPARRLMPDRFESLSKMKDVGVPALVIHGDADEVIPFWMGKRVASAATRSRFIAVTGGHHGDLFARARDRLVGAMVAMGRDRNVISPTP